MGQYENDPNKMVQVIDGQMTINPVAATAAGISSGNLTPEGGYQTTAPFPGMQPTAQQPAPAPTAPPEVPVVPKDIWQADVQALGLEKAIQFAAGKGLAIPLTSDEEFNMLPAGASFVGPDGLLRRKP
jgi:hypothetical protein